MLVHFLTGALLFRRRGRREHLEQGSCRDDVLAGPGEHRGALSVFHYLAVDLARMGTSAPPVSAPPKLPLELCVFLLQLSLGFLQLFLASDEASPPLAGLLPVPPPQRRGTGQLYGSSALLCWCWNRRGRAVSRVSRRILDILRVSIRSACGEALQRRVVTPHAVPGVRS